MPDLLNAIDTLEAALIRQDSPEVVIEHIKVLFPTGAAASSEARTEALPRLMNIIQELDNDLLAGYVGIALGALVERGADPYTAGPMIIERLRRITQGAYDFFVACDEAGAYVKEADTKAIQKTVAETHPLNAFRWNVLEKFYVAPLALLSRSKRLRKETQVHTNLLQQIHAMRHVNTGAEWLDKMLAILDDEPLLVLHLEQKKGYRLTMEGITVNFDLHTLLAAALIGDPAEGWLEGRRPDPEAVESLQSLAATPPQSTSGSFNLINYTGLKMEDNLADWESRHHWIWGEGIPADIAVFEGQRVILLTDPPYERQWSMGRAFDGLIARLHVDQVLTAAEIEEWLKRLRVAAEK